MLAYIKKVPLYSPYLCVTFLQGSKLEITPNCGRLKKEDGVKTKLDKREDRVTEEQKQIGHYNLLMP